MFDIIDIISVKLEESIEVCGSDIAPGMIGGNVKSRKENKQCSPNNVEIISGDVSRKPGQPFMSISSGAKRQRVVTPAAFKAIDNEDQPRSSPNSRKISQGVSLAQDIRDGERRVLTGIEPNIQ
jgi:hypothetical protein